MSTQANINLLVGALFSILVLTACGNKGPLYQTPPQSEQSAETPAGEQDSANNTEQEK